jgi:CRISPR-associated protein Csd1
VTGQNAAIARIHPKIKGVAGSQPAGATIAGFKDTAYWSYGLEQSFNSPVSEDAAHRYTTALNALLDGPKRGKHRLIVGGTTIVFWTEKPTPTEDIFMSFAAEGSEALQASEVQDETIRAKIQAFLKALREGREAYGEMENKPEETRYFILGLATPTPARIAIRFFHEGTLAELLENIRRHHSDIGIERRFGPDSRHPDPEFPPSWFLLRETASVGGDIPPVLPGTLLESIVTDTRYPEALYSAVIRRIAADRILNYPRACIIKGNLVRNRGKEVTMSLDTERGEPPYRLGRLFAALEKTQQDALGGSVGATIRERFYASASATPSSVFPRLLRTYQHHLGKLESGWKVNREKLIQQILDPLSDIPTHLGLVDQGLFALGYYHQMNAFYTKKEDQRKENEE